LLRASGTKVPNSTPLLYRTFFRPISSLNIPEAMATHSTAYSFAVFGILALLQLGPVDCSNAFLSSRGGALTEEAFRDDIMNAMGSVLGCGGEADKAHIETIKSVVMPMWRTIPKTKERIDRRNLRYLVHRYFMKTSSLMVRGFEPTRPTNDSHWGSADILSQMVPAYVESVLEAKHKTQQGFSLQDLIDMILALDQLIFDSESALLENVYDSQRKPVQRSLNYQGLKQILEEYMVKWMVDAEPEDHAILLKNRTLAAQILPHFHELLKFAEGRIKTFEYDRQQRSAKDAWSTRYSFEDAHRIVGGITRSFQAYWQSECASMKESLMSMDKHGTGRVPLAKFYNTAINTDWRFGESEAYLRELGALDESSSWIGAQVIIPNYLQATSNCIVSSAHYLVCCEAECETLMGEIETAIKAPEALPETILALVRTMTSQTTLDQDEPAHLDGNMVEQLNKVAKNHGGMVPLHGRLFAQWLHYVFPHECPFPHKSGAVSATTPSEYGNDYIASKDDMKKHASNTTALDISVTKEELQWLSQWSADEELMTDYGSEGSSMSFVFLLGSMVIVVAGIYGGVFGSNKKGASAGPNSLHSHWV